MSHSSVLLAAYLHNLDPNVIPGLPVKWYGLSYVLAFFAAFFIMRYFSKKKIGQLKVDEASDFITLGALLGVMLGGRLGYMLLYNAVGFFKAPWTLFYLWDGGMSSHGGILGVTIFVFVYCWRKGYNPMAIGDNVVSLAGIGIFFVRMANFINGELWGKPWNGKWAVQFPSEMKDFGEVARRVYAKLGNPQASIDQLIFQARTDERIQQVFREELTARHPSQIYQGLMEGLLLFVILMAVRLRFKNLPWGLLTGIFFISYATMRIIGEVFRHPDSGNIGALSKGQFFSVFMYAIGIGFVIYAFKWGREGAKNLAAKRGK